MAEAAPPPAPALEAEAEAEREPQPQPENSSESTVNFSAALASWRDISLAELQKTLDAQGIEIVSNQKENLVGRKKLAEQTREFKKIPDEAKVSEIKALLKAYQGEIDNLTKRSKLAENSFLSVYKVLAEAPDPYPLLDAAVDSTARASEARILESELSRERAQSASLRTQLSSLSTLESTNARLQSQLSSLEAKVESSVAERVSAKEAELHAMYDERLNNYAEREKDLGRQVELAREQLKGLRESHESTHAKLADHTSARDEDTAARRAESELLLADVERANARVSEMERRNEKLRAEVEAAKSGSEDQERSKELERQISELQAEVTRLLGSLEEQKTLAADVQRRHTKEAEDVRHKLENQAAEVTLLKERQAKVADYDEIKRELDIIKYVEFSTSADDGATEDDSSFGGGGDDTSSLRLPDPAQSSSSSGRGKPLENLLLGKNRKLQEQLTHLRVTHEETETSVTGLRREVEELRLALDAQKGLNGRLENDLLKLNHAPASSPSGQSQGEKRDPLANLNLGKKEVAQPGLTPAAETSILPILTSQRDRFRMRNAELEEDLRKNTSATNELRNEVKVLQADNVKLYEKMRFLQSYDQSSSSVGGGATKSLYPPAKPKEKDDDLGKYKSMYEQSMNPFEAFRGKERSSAVAALNPVERILLGLSNRILGSRAMRGAFVVYALGLHAYVFLLMLFSSGSSSPQSAIDIPQPP